MNTEGLDLSKCAVECEEVKVGDILKVYGPGNLTSGECTVKQILGLYRPTDFKKVPVVCVEYEVENLYGKKHTESTKLQYPGEESCPFRYFNAETKEKIKTFTLKEEYREENPVNQCNTLI